MMHFEFLDPSVSAKLCLTLLHSLWQFSLLYGLLWIAERAIEWRGGKQVETFYALHVSALILGLVALPITWMVLDIPAAAAPTQSSVATSPLPSRILAEADSKSFAVQSQTTTLNNDPVDPREPSLAAPMAGLHPEPDATPIPTSSVAPEAEVVNASTWIRLSPALVGGYAIGVAFMLVRLFLAIWTSVGWARRATRVQDGPLVETLAGLAQRWKMKAAPMLAVAETIIIPQIVGLWRPVILLPTSAVAGMKPDELELILIHEMAHLKRHDMWINLLQRLSETVLFFNPALWLLNRRISLLREFCCDDLTVTTQPSEAEPQLRYATALLKAVELCTTNRSHQPELTALAAGGQSPSELRKRIARLFGEPLREPVGISRGGLLAAIGASLMLVGPMLWPLSAADEQQQTESKSVET